MSERMNKYSTDISTYNWALDQEDGKILRITKSALGTFNWCPKQYEFEKMQRLPSDTRDYHIRGVNVHFALEDFYIRFPDHMDGILEAVDADLKHKALALTVKAFPPPEEMRRHEDDDAVGTSLLKYGEDEAMRQLAEWELDRLIITRGEDFLPIGNEQWVEVVTEIEVDGVIVPVHIRGEIDRIFRDEAGGLALMELKTGKWNSRKASDMRMELSVYKFMLDEKRKTPEGKAWLAERGLDAPVTHFGWRYPLGGTNGGDGAHWGYATCKKTSMNAMMKRLHSLISAHLNKRFKMLTEIDRWNAPWKCSYCDQMAYCPAWTDGNSGVVE